MENVGFTPSKDRLVIKVSEDAKVTTGGLHIPGDNKEKSSLGTIIAIGPDVESEKAMFNIQVLFKKWGGSPLKLNGQEYLVVEEKEIIGYFS